MGRYRDGEVTNLSFEEDSFIVDNTRIEARLMEGRGEAAFSEDGISVFFPQSASLWVSLHGREDGNHMPFGDVAAVTSVPPVLERFVGADEESLLRWRGFAEGVGYICSKNKEILRCNEGIEQA